MLFPFSNISVLSLSKKILNGLHKIITILLVTVFKNTHFCALSFTLLTKIALNQLKHAFAFSLNPLTHKVCKLL